jgi:hypothetical protein
MNETLNKKMENLEIVSIPDFPRYYISINGDVYSDKKLAGKIIKLKPRPVTNGYLAVHLYNDKIHKTKTIHRIIAETFLYKDTEKSQVDHINGNVSDNRLDNLRWVTQSENMKNTKKPKDNKSGKTGVFFDKHGKRWTSCWQDFNHTENRKGFPIRKYGYEQAKQLAIDYRKEMEKIYYPTKERFD